MQPSVHPLVEVEAAQAVIRDHTPLLSREVVSLGAALGRFLAEDVRAPRDLPTDPTSTVDGYALRAGEQGDLVIVGESGAGHPFRGEVPPGSAVRIMTGAIVPTGLEAVAMIEDVVEKGDRVEVSSLPSGSNIRRLGDDIRSGEMALQRGQSIGAAELGLAAALGLPRLPVHRRPKVALISTGDELVEVGSVVGPGQIIDSNRWALAAALTQSGAEVEELGSAPDDSEALRPIFEDAFTRNQVLVSSGGVSTGSHDNVKPLLAKLGHLHIGRVRLKPGMPFTFATLPEGQLAFGLPGFPVSSLVTFEVFVRPTLLRMQGSQHPERPRLRVRMGFPVELGDRTEYHRVRLEWRGEELWASSTGVQFSSRLLSLTGAHALVHIPSGQGQRLVGAIAEALILQLP